MLEESQVNQYKIQKATEHDWHEILTLLKDTKLAFWLTGKETYHDFYIARDSIKKNIACCFAIYFKGEVGIVKSFAIRTDLQGKGLGKKIANDISNIGEKIGLKEIYACSWEAPRFWTKTNFKEINVELVTNQYYLNYSNYLRDKFPDHYKDIKHFLLEIKT